MNADDRLCIDTAHALALESSMHPRVGCVIDGPDVAIGYNEAKTHPMQAMWAARVGRQSRIFLHAEMAALISYLKTRGREPIERAYIVRLGKGGEYRPSFPCPVCYPALEYAGVREIIYFDKSGTFSKFDCLSKSSQVLGD